MQPRARHRTRCAYPTRVHPPRTARHGASSCGGCPRASGGACMVRGRAICGARRTHRRVDGTGGAVCPSIAPRAGVGNNGDLSGQPIRSVGAHKHRELAHARPTSVADRPAPVGSWCPLHVWAHARTRRREGKRATRAFQVPHGRGSCRGGDPLVVRNRWPTGPCPHRPRPHLASAPRGPWIAQEVMGECCVRPIVSTTLRTRKQPLERPEGSSARGSQPLYRRHGALRTLCEAPTQGTRPTSRR